MGLIHDLHLEIISVHENKHQQIWSRVVCAACVSLSAVGMSTPPGMSLLSLIFIFLHIYED